MTAEWLAEWDAAYERLAKYRGDPMRQVPACSRQRYEFMCKLDDEWPRLRRIAAAAEECADRGCYHAEHGTTTCREDWPDNRAKWCNPCILRAALVDEPEEAT